MSRLYSNSLVAATVDQSTVKIPKIMPAGCISELNNEALASIKKGSKHYPSMLIVL